MLVPKANNNYIIRGSLGQPSNVPYRFGANIVHVALTWLARMCDIASVLNISVFSSQIMIQNANVSDIFEILITSRFSRWCFWPEFICCQFVHKHYRYTLQMGMYMSSSENIMLVSLLYHIIIGTKTINKKLKIHNFFGILHQGLSVHFDGKLCTNIMSVPLAQVPQWITFILGGKGQDQLLNIMEHFVLQWKFPWCLCK